MAQNKTGMHTGNAFDAGYFVQQQVLVTIHITDNDFELVVRRLAGDQQALDNFRDVADQTLKVGKTLRRVLVHRDMDQRH